MRPILSLTLFVCALASVPKAAAQQPSTKPEEGLKTPVLASGARADDADGLQVSVTTSSADTLDDGLDRLHQAIHDYLEANSQPQDRKSDKLHTPSWMRFGVDPFKFTFAPTFGNAIASAFYQPVFAFGNTTFKPGFQAVYELSFRNAMELDDDKPGPGKSIKPYLRFLSVGIAAGIDTPGDKPFMVTGPITQLEQNLKTGFSVYAKFEVPLSNLFGSKHRAAAAKEQQQAAQRKLQSAQFLLMQQLDQAVAQLRAAIRRQKPGDIAALSSTNERQ